jgi:hypothetical protein
MSRISHAPPAASNCPSNFRYETHFSSIATGLHFLMTSRIAVLALLILCSTSAVFARQTNTETSLTTSLADDIADGFHSV